MQLKPECDFPEENMSESWKLFAAAPSYKLLQAAATAAIFHLF